MDPVILRDYSGSHEQPEELDALLADAATDTDDAAAPQDQVAPEAEEYGLAIRALALLCACCLSVGSHYGSYILGPLKSRLAREVGTSNSQFSLIVSAYSLNSTWTPLIGGLLVTRFGPAIISVFATSFVLVGLLGLLVGLSTHTIWLMILGMFVFGLGTSPLSVAQESIILQFFRFKGRGISLALGLLAGKGASFIAANTSFPLSEQYGPRAPFIVAVMLALFSWAINLVYLTFYNRLVAKSRDRNASLRAAKVVSHIAAKRDFQWRIIPKLGDTFWIYLTMNIFCGAIWYPFIHLSANIIERRYGLTESNAGFLASLLLSGSVLTYPIVGHIIDKAKTPLVAQRIFLLAGLLTLTGFLWLFLPPKWTKTPTPTMIFFGIGQGPAPLLLVLMVPQIVAEAYIPTALGAHKSLEQAGATISQALAGFWLDSKGDKDEDQKKNLGPLVQILLGAYVFVNLLQIACLVWLVRVMRRRMEGGVRVLGARTEAEERRGRVGMASAALVVVGAWAVFLGLAWLRLS